MYLKYSDIDCYLYYWLNGFAIVAVAVVDAKAVIAFDLSVDVNYNFDCNRVFVEMLNLMIH